MELLITHYGFFFQGSSLLWLLCSCFLLKHSNTTATTTLDGRPEYNHTSIWKRLLLHKLPVCFPKQVEIQGMWETHALLGFLVQTYLNVILRGCQRCPGGWVNKQRSFDVPSTPYIHPPQLALDLNQTGVHFKAFKPSRDAPNRRTATYFRNMSRDKTPPVFAEIINLINDGLGMGWISFLVGSLAGSWFGLARQVLK